MIMFIGPFGLKEKITLGSIAAVGAFLSGAAVAAVAMALMQHLNVSELVVHNCQFGLKIVASVGMVSAGVALLAIGIAGRILNIKKECQNKSLIRDIIIISVALFALIGASAASIALFTHNPATLHFIHLILQDAAIGAGGIIGIVALLAFVELIREKGIASGSLEKKYYGWMKVY